MSDIVAILPYDQEWSTRYAGEAALIRKALGDVGISIEHIGSTSVPGLAAKPTIDILVGVESLSLEAATHDAMASLGYVHVPELSPPDRLFFGKGRYTDRAFNAHFVVWGGPVWTEDLLFRDYLRSHPDRAAAYARVKRWAALEPDRYGARKAPFIAETLELAGSWGASRQ